MLRTVRALAAVIAISAGIIAAPATHAVADTWTHPHAAHAVADTWTRQPAAVSWG
jgi:hypothetical protein